MGSIAFASGSNAYDGDDELADAHSESTPDEKWTSAKLVDGPECDGGCNGVDWMM